MDVRGKDKKPRKKRSKLSALKDAIRNIAADVKSKEPVQGEPMPFASTLPRVKEFGRHAFKGEVAINLKDLKDE